MTEKEQVGIFWGDETLLFPGFCHGYTNVCVKTGRIVQVNFSSFKLYHNKKQKEDKMTNKYLVLARTGNNWNCHVLLVGIYKRTATWENNLTVPYKIKHIFPMGPVIALLSIYPEK